MGCEALYLGAAVTHQALHFERISFCDKAPREALSNFFPLSNPQLIARSYLFHSKNQMELVIFIQYYIIMYNI